MISFFQKGQITLLWFVLLLFNGFYDICNQYELTSGCCFGGIHKVLLKYDSEPETTIEINDISISYSVCHLHCSGKKQLPGLVYSTNGEGKFSHRVVNIYMLFYCFYSLF